MKKAIPIGVSDYERLRKEDYYFVDKSMMIQEFLRRKSIVTLITRPRRFGKTINMSMMAEFFDVTKDTKDRLPFICQCEEQQAGIDESDQISAAQRI